VDAPDGTRGSTEDRPATVLVVAATAFELETLLDHVVVDERPSSAWGAASRGRIGRTDVVVQPLGLGKANTAGGLVAALHAWRPRAVIQVGVGGAYLGSFLSIGMAAIATQEIDLDLGVRSADGWRDLATLGFPLTPALGDRPERSNTVPTHEGLRAAFGHVAPLERVRFATLDAITGDVDVGAALAREHDVSIESMEGVAAAQVCDRLGVPFAEVRGVSNIVGERDRARWNLRSGARAATDAVRALLARWHDLEETAALDRRPRW
jgi:futalosine hydrolase